MIYNLKEQKLALPSMEIDTITFGSGSRHLILIQGLNTRGIRGAGIPLAYMYRMFAKDYTVHLFERRPEIRQDTTLRELASDIAMAMDALAITRADVVGVSQGGMIAQYLAIDRPDLVNRLVLAVTLSKPNDTVRSVIETWTGLTRQGRMGDLVEDMAVRMYSEAYVRRYRPFLPLLTLLQTPKDPQRFIHLAQACLTCNTDSELEKIQCPVFVIGGRKDHIVTAAASEEIAEKLNCSIYLYEDLGHAAYEEAPDFNKRIFDFLMAQAET